MPILPGATLGRYTLLKRLSEADVWLARASGAAGFEHHVVIKRMRAQPGRDDAVNAFLDELRLAGSLHHHHIVQVHDAGREGNDFYFAMEYVHGEDLRKILTRVVKRNESIPLDHIVTIGIAVAQALHHAHEQRAPDGTPLQLVHRDVSPANVIVGYDGTVKVLDFGIAKAVGRTTQTRAGQLRGKAPYMAPEQCAGQSLDRRADIFALGIVLWELVTARRLFKGANDFMTMAAIVAGKVPKPTLIRSDLPADFEQIIMKALSLAPQQRFQTAEELGIALEEMATNNIIRISQAALAAYLKQLFGQRPEPWLVTEEDTNVEGRDVDFDGNAGGVVKVTREQLQNLDAVREVMTAQTSNDATDDEFDDQPQTELVEAPQFVPAAADARELAATIEAAKLLRPSMTMQAVAPPEPQGRFEVPTSVVDHAEIEQLLRMSAQLPAETVTETTRPGNVAAPAPNSATLPPPPPRLPPPNALRPAPPPPEDTTALPTSTFSAPPTGSPAEWALAEPSQTASVKKSLSWPWLLVALLGLAAGALVVAQLLR